MKLQITLLFTITLTINAYTQNLKFTLGKVKQIINESSISITTGEKSKAEVYYNASDKIIDIDGFQIPLLEVKPFYLFDEKRNRHVVNFVCNTGECITDSEMHKVIGMGLAFTSKKICYDFIAAISDLKK